MAAHNVFLPSIGNEWSRDAQGLVCLGWSNFGEGPLGWAELGPARAMAEEQELLAGERKEDKEK